MIRNWMILGCKEGYQQSIYIAHGILGSAQNWRGFASRWAKLRPLTRFVLMDLRNHGRSGVAEAPHSLEACAKDLWTLGEDIGHPDILIGHSFGGKVVLKYLEACDGHSPDQVWLLDSAVGAMDLDSSELPEVLKVIHHIRQIPMPLSNRQALVEILMKVGFSEGLSRWMTTNLKSVEGGYDWRFELEGVEAMIMDYFAQDLWHLIELPLFSEVFVLRAMESDRWTDEIVARIQGSLAQYIPLSNAGHWVHVDNPEGLLRILESNVI